MPLKTSFYQRKLSSELLFFVPVSCLYCIYLRWVWLELMVFSERELKFMFAICHRPSVRLSSVVCRLSVCRLSVTFVRHTQTIEIFGNVSMP